MTQRPPTKSHLERLITANSNDSTISVGRIRRWITTMILIKAFDSARDSAENPLFVVKGGVAMELRLGISARMTNDVDATFYGSPTELETILEIAFADPISGFTITASPIMPIGKTGAVRTTARLEYQRRPWGSIDVEFAIGEPPAEIEIIEAINITHFGLDGPKRVAALPVRIQLAQKLHAVSQQFPAGENKRIRDIVDILLLQTLADDLAVLRRACVEVFNTRAMHSWPPTITIYDSWPEEHARLCETIGFATTDVFAAVDEVHQFIAGIDAAHTPTPH